MRVAWFARAATAALLSVYGAVVLAMPAGDGPLPAVAEIFLDRLVGDWRGRAELTPLGPLRYDLEFTRAPDQSVRGTAAPGGALHHWRFFVRGGVLWLRFLTTFRGNTEPVWLTLASCTEVDGGSVRLVAVDPSYLVVEAAVAPRELHLDIFLHGQPHVRVRLRRADP